MLYIFYYTLCISIYNIHYYFNSFICEQVQVLDMLFFSDYQIPTGFKDV